MHAEKMKCKTCGKILVDEKIFCRRCNLEGRNKIKKVAAVAGGILGAVLFAKSQVDKHNNENDASQI